MRLRQFVGEARVLRQRMRFWRGAPGSMPAGYREVLCV
jgi:hypothetical protein